jgi:hypothetical protein
MSASGFSPTQAGVYALLMADGTLLAMIDGVFDDIPLGAETHYVVIGEATEVPFRTFGKAAGIISARGHEVTFTIHVWTQDETASAGSKVAQLIIDRVTELMENNTLAITGHTVVTSELEFSEVMRSFDSVTGLEWRHGVARYRITSQDSV